MQKQCPKCNNIHNKSGIYCSRSCANSRTFSEETNQKRALSNKLSTTAFWSNNPKTDILRNTRRKIYLCPKCNLPTYKKDKLCSSCKLIKSNKSRKTVQRLLTNNILPAQITPVILPQFGTKGRGGTFEKEQERIRKIKEKAKVKNNGGYRQGSGRGKKGWYKGIFCDSSWELAYILYCEFNNIEVYRNTEKFEYEFDGKIYHYLPDFIVGNNFIEIKGYMTQKNLAKITQFPHNKYKLIVYLEEDIKPILKFIIDRYGKDYIKLYEQGKLCRAAPVAVLKTDGT